MGEAGPGLWLGCVQTTRAVIDPEYGVMKAKEFESIPDAQSKKYGQGRWGLLGALEWRCCGQGYWRQ